MNKLSLKVDGITCSGCAVDVATSLKGNEGVHNAEASYAAGTVDVEFHPGEISEAQVLDLVKRLGLRVKEDRSK